MFFVSPVCVFAQTANDTVMAYQKTLAIFGSVDYNDAAGFGFNVNYSFSPVDPTSIVLIHLNTANAAPLSLKILDASNNTVKTWTPVKTTDRYETELDISALASGSYKYVIYWDSHIVKEITFNKN